MWCGGGQCQIFILSTSLGDNGQHIPLSPMAFLNATFREQLPYKEQCAPNTWFAPSLLATNCMQLVNRVHIPIAVAK